MQRKQRLEEEVTALHDKLFKRSSKYSQESFIGQREYTKEFQSFGIEELEQFQHEGNDQYGEARGKFWNTFQESMCQHLDKTSFERTEDIYRNSRN